MKKAGLYLRVSTDEQVKHGISLETQLKKLQDYCQFKGWEIFKIYKDEGISGTSLKKRKGFQEMLNDARNNKIQIILVTKFDRAFRNVVDALNTIDELKELKVDFVSVSEDIDTTTPMGRALYSIIGIFAELESKKNSERVRDGRLNQFSKGLIVGRTHFGYKPIYKDKEHKRGIINIVPHPKESLIVKNVFQMASEGKDYKEICKKYNLKPQQYYNIIKNKVYIGIITFENKERKGIHEPLISEEVFNKLNDKI
jgi:site-specific DNA recombinase